MTTHLAKKLLLIQPANFEFNDQTADTNRFQKLVDKDSNVAEEAFKEFDRLIALLKQKDLDLVVHKSTKQNCPDAVFPNNWISFHKNKKLVLYPMLAPNRRTERDAALISKFSDYEKADLSFYEQDNLFLEGTGSLVLDREAKLAYMAKSPRSSPKVLDVFCRKMGYRPLSFTAHDQNESEIYHTNVMMSMGRSLAVVCLESVTNSYERQGLVNSLAESGKEIIEISFDQMNNFAGNILLVENSRAEPFWLMSSTAYKSLTTQQINHFEKDGQILHSPIPTIESLGGGSVRCMIAEVF